MLLDSNILIYAAKPEHGDLRRFIADHAPAVSAVSIVEVLGFHRITTLEKQLCEKLFSTLTVLPISQDVVNQAVKLRQSKKMGLGDSLVAATAQVHGRTLVTRNVKDFEWIDGLKLLNPFSS